MALGGRAWASQGPEHGPRVSPWLMRAWQMPVMTVAAGSGGLSVRALSLLAGRLVRLRGVLGVRQHLAELVLSEQLVSFQVL